VLWKPAESASLVAHLTMELLREAGLPDGVINVVYGDGAEIGEVALKHRDLAGVAFTGSTGTFQHIWRTVGANISSYRNYPRVVGETGGKDFVLAHHSADIDALATACIRGAYEYQGQKCAAASRLYAPRSIWPHLRDRLVDLTRSVVVGDPAKAETYVGAVVRPASSVRPAGVSPVPVGAGAPGSGPRFVVERRRAERGVESLFGGSDRAGRSVMRTLQPRHNYNGRAEPLMSRRRPCSSRWVPDGVAGLPGVWAMARTEGLAGNRRGPSAHACVGQETGRISRW
jgi:hypothetical protein